MLGEAMLRGELDEPRARAFVDWTQGLTSAQAGEVCDRLLPEAPRLMVGELIDRIKRACLAIDPEWAEKRYRESVRTRRVVGSRNPDGTANLGGYQQPLDRIAAASDRIDAMARTCKRAGDRRPIDHIRSDLFIGMTDGTFEGMTEAEIINYVLANPYVDPGDQPDGVDSGGAGDGADSGGGGDGDGEGGNSGGGSGGGQPGQAPSTPGGPVEAGEDSRDDRGSGNADRARRLDAGTGAWTVPELRVALSTILGKDEHPGHIPPWGYVTAGHARELIAKMHSAEWRYVLCDAYGYAIGGGLVRARPVGVDGSRVRRDARRGGLVEIAVSHDIARMLITSPQPSTAAQGWQRVLAEIAKAVSDTSVPEGGDQRRRVPGARLRRWVELRDRVCVHPACRAPARTADQDHRHDYAEGGQTTEDNLEPKCRHDHRVKHEGGWQVERQEPGVTVWTSALGHRYESRPPPVITPLPPPLPDDGNDERLVPRGQYEWQPRHTPCECDEPCACAPPLLPPVPRRVIQVEPTVDPSATVIFDPDDKPPF
jgi:hypothetical protein